MFCADLTNFTPERRDELKKIFEGLVVQLGRMPKRDDDGFIEGYVHLDRTSGQTAKPRVLCTGDVMA